MPVYKVELPRGGHVLKDNNNGCVVFAGNADDAKALAQSQNDQDAAPWDQATVTEITENAEFGDLIIRISIPADEDNAFEDDFSLDYTVPDDETADTVDEIGDLLVAALNATDELGSVTYTAGTDLVTIVAANDCGLSEITATVHLVGPDGVEYEVTSMELTVGEVGDTADSDRTIALTPLGSGVRPTFVTGYRASISHAS